MKKNNNSLNAVFSVAGEMKTNNGEDSYLFDVAGNEFIIAAFDGLGGAGAKRYMNYSEKTGAYIASRAVCGGVMSWFQHSRKDKEFENYISDVLNICSKYADPAGRIMGSLGKSFPTTAAVVKGSLGGDGVNVTCYWAGDSRCYLIDANGLHQLTEDDLDGQDAMSNLSNDGVMTNTISASSPYVIHRKELNVSYPCILLTATDGCFGYLRSPMEFENLLTDSLVNSKNLKQWQQEIENRILAVTGDDYTLCVAVCGFNDYESIVEYIKNRNSYVFEKYVKCVTEPAILWEQYKKNYSKYL